MVHLYEICMYYRFQINKDFQFAIITFTKLLRYYPTYIYIYIYVKVLVTKKNLLAFIFDNPMFHEPAVTVYSIVI